LAIIYNLGQESEGISGRPQQKSDKSDELQHAQMHPSQGPGLLAFIGHNFKDWFTPEEVYEKLGQLSPEEIRDFCSSVSHFGFFKAAEGSFETGKWKFKIGFKFF
jgi:hypothetical protein